MTTQSGLIYRIGLRPIEFHFGGQTPESAWNALISDVAKQVAEIGQDWSDA